MLGVPRDAKEGERMNHTKRNVKHEVNKHFHTRKHTNMHIYIREKEK